LKKVALGIVIGVGIISAFIALFAYSYSQVHLQLQNISFENIDWAPASGGTAVSFVGNVITGNSLGAALALVDGININLNFAASNAGFLPVEIPTVSYDLLINDVNIGRGQNDLSTVIGPGEVKTLPVLQVIKKASVSPALASIVENGGVLKIKATGTAQFMFLGVPIPVPFESTKEISIMDEVKARFSGSEPNKVSTFLTLSTSAYAVTVGDTVRFSGALADAENNGIAGSVVYIQDEDAGSGDEYLRSALTDQAGRFSVSWTAQNTDFLDNEIEVFASYKGSDVYRESRSGEYVIRVSSPQNTPVQITPSVQKQDTSISLQSSSYSPDLGDTVRFSGTLISSDGEGISNVLVYVKDEDTGSGDDILGSVYTTFDGTFAFSWVAEKGDPFDDVVEIYAVFEGSNFFSDSKSRSIDIQILEPVPSVPDTPEFQETYIVLDISDISPQEGAIVRISGTLFNYVSEPVANAPIFIKDEDSGSGDDDIALVYTESDGDFEYSWSARSMDPFDSVVEIYAVFEGSTYFGQARSEQINIEVG
jgi:hypothetical protein